MTQLPAALHWQLENPAPLAISDRLAHVRYCSPFVAGLLDRYPHWLEELSQPDRRAATKLAGLIADAETRTPITLPQSIGSNVAGVNFSHKQFRLVFRLGRLQSVWGVVLGTGWVMVCCRPLEDQAG